MSTTNQKRQIVTMEGPPRGFQATTDLPTADNPYYEKGASGAVVHDTNYISTDKCGLAEATSERTLIREFRVIHADSRIGVEAGGGRSICGMKPSHSVGSRNDLTLNHYAKATGHSIDVKVESHWIVRHDDPTLQDRGNGPGTFTCWLDDTYTEDINTLLDKQCSVDTLVLRCDHGREGREGFLEVVQGSKVTVELTRVNATEVDPKAPADPEAKKPKPNCREPKRKRGRRELRGKPHGHLFFNRPFVPAAWFRGDMYADGVPEWSDFKQSDIEELGADWLGEPSDDSDVLEVDGRNSKLLASGEGKDMADSESGSTKDGALAVWALADLVALWNAEPIIIDVEGHACAGAQKAQIRSYPDREVTIPLMDLKEVAEGFRKIKSVLMAVYTWFSTIQEIQKAVGGAATPQLRVAFEFFGLKFAKSGKEEKGEAEFEPMVDLTLQWKELERDGVDWRGEKVSKACVRRSWKLEVGVKRVVLVFIVIQIPLTSVVSKLGEIASWLLAKASKPTDDGNPPTGLFFVIDINLETGFKGTLDWDQHGAFSGAIEGANASVGFFLSIRAQIGTAFSLTLSAGISFEPTYGIRFSKKSSFADFFLGPTKILSQVTLRVEVDVFGWTIDKTFAPLTLVDTEVGGFDDSAAAGLGGK